MQRYFTDLMEEKKNPENHDFFACVFPTDSTLPLIGSLHQMRFFDNQRRYSGFGFQGFNSKLFCSRCQLLRKSLNFQLSMQVHFTVRGFADFGRHIVFTRPKQHGDQSTESPQAKIRLYCMSIYTASLSVVWKAPL